MFNFKRYPLFGVLALALGASSCKVPAITPIVANENVPANYENTSGDTNNSANLAWQTFFTDKKLISLIDTALKNNQELNTTLQEIEIAKSEVRLKQGQLLPTVGARLGLGVEKVGRYTSQGAGDASTEISPGKPVPDPLMDYTVGAYANWEVDIWKKLRTAKKAAIRQKFCALKFNC
jgi:multidrug efflux system outer membrane protein